MKRLLTAVCVIALMAGCSDQQAQMQTDVPVPVSVEELVLKPIEEFVTVTGTVIATKDIMVTSEASGFYRKATNPATSKPYALGDKIAQDAVIVYLDNPEQENSIRIDSQTLNLDITKSEFEKQQSLYEKGGVTLRELKNSEKSYIDAKYSYENAVMQLAKLKVTAPFKGVIIDIPYFTIGEKTTSGADMLHIMDYSTLNMDVSIPGKLLGQIEVDQPVRVVNYTMPDNNLDGKITEVSPALDPETRTFMAKVAIDNPDLLLRPGMFVKAEIITARKDSTIVIPKDIILARRNRKTVFVVETGFARERRIEAGLENPDILEVTEGLKKGERIVINGFETLRNNSKVNIVQ